ncbi:5-aminolevulic acid synthase [Haematobacter genomosp. 1]|uniref:5-aminolevulic acid synthase n=1 Tax=Haematobacter genomosp. 1 TaxID=366618 RepID=A0A212AGC3_9RHOB|nr:5-aminolevulic acid synthase [Haematobacter genomosp. 1]OWJ80558.1 5-aminolevulic acid synthase [Haematobacter genomosp. 1]
MRIWIMAAALTLVAGAAAAGPVDGAVAKGALFSPKGAQASIGAQPFLSSSDIKVLEQVAATQKYYGAVALSPDEGLMSEATFAAANYHAVEPAREAALAACNARRKKGSKPCVLVGDILPVGWTKGRPVQLSTDATAGFEQDYLPAKAPKALAGSLETGHWAIATGAGAREKAVQDCAAKGGAGDCRVLLAD